MDKPHFLSPLRLLKFQNFLFFLFIVKLSCSKPFWNNLNCASTANIQEAMKFYNLGDNCLETDRIVSHGLSPVGHRFKNLYFVSYQELGCPT